MTAIIDRILKEYLCDGIRSDVFCLLGLYSFMLLGVARVLPIHSKRVVVFNLDI